MERTVTDPLVGRLLDGRYLVERLLARGGMATVYTAMDTRLERPVALKAMHPALAEDHEFVSRFIREARSAARLSHPNVVSVYDQGADDGVVFLAMEYVAGRTLRDLLRERGRLTPREALDLLEPVLSALGAAHRAGIVHRDVKPENVLLADDGRVKVADFGLARAASANGSSQATRGVLIGTVAYLSPEQVQRGIADPRSDVYAVGILLDEMLTGAPPFAAETPLAVAYRHVHEDVPAPSTVVPGLAPALDELVQRATARDPDERPADATQLLRLVQETREQLSPAELGAGEETLDLRETLVVPVPGAPAVAAPSHHTMPVDLHANGFGDPVAVPAPATGPPSQPPKAAMRGHRRRPVVIGLLLLLLVTAGVGYGAWYLGSGRYTAMPGVLKLTPDQATAKLADAGLKSRLGDAQFDETVKAGLVLSTDPAPGAQVRRGSTVTLVLSRGPERYAVPDLRGQTVDRATALLTANHLALGEQKGQYSETVPKGQVISSLPQQGERVKPDTPVRVVVSKGVPPVKVATVTGQSLDQATKTLQDQQLKAKQTDSRYSETVPQGAVISQNPAAGASVPRGTTVQLVVSKGPPLVTVPDVVGMRTNDARTALQKAGFAVNVREVLGGLFNTVRLQSPSGGTKAPKGSTVTITIV